MTSRDRVDAARDALRERRDGVGTGLTLLAAALTCLAGCTTTSANTDGAGPENVNHNEPGNGVYAVGVYYYDDNGFGPSYATVRIYIDGKLAKEYKNKYMSGTFDFWKVGLIEWPSKNIYKRDEKFEGFPNSGN